MITRVTAWLRLSRREGAWKIAEILILRHQLLVRPRQPAARPKLAWADRALLTALVGVMPKARRKRLQLLDYGGDQPVCPQRSGQLPDQRRQHRAICPVQPGPRAGAAQHGDLMPQHQQLDVLGGRRSVEQDQPGAEPGEDQVKQAEGHG